MQLAIRRLVLVLGAVLAAPVATAHAQAPLAVGGKLLNVGLFADGGTGLGVGFEVGVLELAPRVTLGLGGTFGFWGDSGPGVDVTSIPILANANVHFGLAEVPQLDLFGGIGLGIVRSTFDYDGPGEGPRDDSDTKSAFGVNLGARYEFTQQLGGIVQLGIGDIPELFLGVSIKF